MAKKVPAYDGGGQYAFVSYSHKNSRVVCSVIEQLTQMGYNIWYDEGIPLVSDYGGVLYDRIKNCAVFVLFVSHESVRSEDVEKEATHAISFKKPIVQIVIDEDAELPSSVAYHLPKTKQYLPISCEPKEFYSKLAAALSGCKGQGGTAYAAPTAPKTLLKPGDLFAYGRYIQNGSAAEAVQWRVLKVEADRALVISDLAIDTVKFNESWLTGTRWEVCALRKWLNETFIRTAFTEEERGRILKVKIKNPNSEGAAYFDSTEDRIFCLSVPEAQELFSGDKERITQKTTFAKNRLLFSTGGACRWWLRTMGMTNSQATFVEIDGRVITRGTDPNDKHIAVRPAFYIAL